MFMMLLHIVTSIEYLPIFGSTEFPGYYYTKVSIGTPKRTKKLMIDLGSDLLAIPCIGCESCGKDPASYFNYEESNTSILIHKNDEKSNLLGKFNYSVHYIEGSQLKGFFIKDILRFTSTKGKYINITATVGCNSIQTGVLSRGFVDGIIGLPILKNSKHSLMTSMLSSGTITKKIFSICISTYDGFISFGGIDENYNDGEISWIYLKEGSHFEFTSDQVLLGSKPFIKTIRTHESFILASGSTLSYFREVLFNEFIFIFQDFCSYESNCNAKSASVAGFEELCFENNEKSENFDFESFPNFEFRFDDLKIIFKPENYMIRVRPGVFCIGILMNYFTNMNVLGTNFLRGKHFYFDFEKMKAGIAESICDFNFNASEAEYFINEVDQVTELDIMKNSFYVFTIFCILNLVVLIVILAVKRLSKVKVNSAHVFKYR